MQCNAKCCHSLIESSTQYLYAVSLAVVWVAKYQQWALAIVLVLVQDGARWCQNLANYLWRQEFWKAVHSPQTIKQTS